MKLTQQTIRVITSSIVAALVGLVVLQYILLRNAYEFRQQAFEQNVRAAMNRISEKLEGTEALGKVFRFALAAPSSKNKVMTLRMETDSSSRSTRGDSLAIITLHSKIDDPMPVRIENNSIQYHVSTPQHIRLRVFDVIGRHDTLLVDGFKEAGEYTIPFVDPAFVNGDVMVKFQTDSSAYTLHCLNGNFNGVVENSIVRSKREEIIGRVVENLSLSERDPIETRLQPALLDSVIGQTLSEVNITLPFVYGVLSGGNDSIRVGKTEGFEKDLRSSGYRNRLFPNDFLFSGNQLLLYFPGQNMYLLKQVGWLLVLTVLFMSVIVLCFVYTIRTIIQQKLFSVRLMDFVNNMTHEFKTPISTISVAAETITRPDIREKADKITRYSEVIKDESARMKKHVDTILQMAVLEEGDYELKLADVDMNEIIRSVAGNASLQVEMNGGSIEPHLDAEYANVSADAMHLTNIIQNVLDNACKYSPLKPAIVISTKNYAGNIITIITDHGIGISKEDLPKVFDKYYRVHTGNVHDVKGFGIGLCYVKMMTEALGGTISIESELGRGTTVQLIFPLSNHRDG